MARSGLFVAPVPGTPPVGTAPQDARIALAALLGTTPQLAAGGQLTQSGSTMQITVGASVFELPDVTATNALFLSPTDQTVLTPAAGPGTGSRIDSIVVKQNNFDNSDADSRVSVYLKAGAASGSPTPPALAAGEYRWANVAVPTNAANAAACTITVLSPTVLLPLPLKAPTFALLNTVTGQIGQHAFVSTDGTASKNGDYLWDGSAWKQLNTLGRVAFTPTLLNFTKGATVITGWYMITNGFCFFFVKMVLGSGWFISGGAPYFAPPVPMLLPTDGGTVGDANYHRVGLGDFNGLLRSDPSGNVKLGVPGGSGAYWSPLTATTPAGWDNGDTFTLQGAYPY
jgi:hypothetical protein